MSVGGTNQLLQCGECGHWSGEAAPATSLVTAAAGGNQFRDVSHDTWRGLGPGPGPRTCTHRGQEY